MLHDTKMKDCTTLLFTSAFFSSNCTYIVKDFDHRPNANIANLVKYDTYQYSIHYILI